MSTVVARGRGPALWPFVLNTITEDKLTRLENRANSPGRLAALVGGGAVAGGAVGGATDQKHDLKSVLKGAIAGAFGGAGSFAGRAYAGSGFPWRSQTVNRLGAAGGVVPGVALGKLVGDNLLAEKPKPRLLPPKAKPLDWLRQSLGLDKTAAAEAGKLSTILKGVGKEIKHQLPHANTRDWMLGGVGGAALHTAQYGLPTDDTDKKQYAKGLLKYMGVGAAGTNVAMDRGRRWLSHNFTPFNYTGGQQLARPTLRNIYYGAIRDRTDPQQIARLRAGIDRPFTDVSRKENLHAYLARKELWRRFLGVHTDDPAKDYFKNLGKGAIKYNPQTVTPTSEAGQVLLNSPSKNTLLGFRGNDPKDVFRDYRYDLEGGQAPLKNVWGGHDWETVKDLAGNPLAKLVDAAHLPEIGGFNRLSQRDIQRALAENRQRAFQKTYRLRDTWDFRVDPAEVVEGGGYVGEMLKHPLRIPEILRSPPRWAGDRHIADEYSGHKVHNRFTEWLKRHLLENVIRGPYTPVIKQDLRYTLAPARAVQQMVDENTRRGGQTPDWLTKFVREGMLKNPDQYVPIRGEAL